MATPIIDGYEDFRLLGSGGQAAVYRAVLRRRGIDVAVKLLHASSIDEEHEQRLERELRVVGSLDWHPHIARVEDAGHDINHRAYVAFELLERGTLGELLKREGALSWQKAVEFTIQIADALTAAHELSVLHRDVKPSNILIDRIGRAKLSDFGLADLGDDEESDEDSDPVPTTLVHMAPELIDPGVATKQSDQYSLASTLFELATGYTPFHSEQRMDSQALISRILTREPPRLDSVADVDSEVADVVARCLRKDPTERFSSVRQVALELSKIQLKHSLRPTPMPFIEAGTTIQHLVPTEILESEVEDLTLAGDVFPEPRAPVRQTEQSVSFEPPDPAVNQAAPDVFATIDIAGFSDLRLVASGGFSRVYAGRQHALNRDVAVKVLELELRTEKERQIFERECQAMGSGSSHPHIATVYDATYDAAGSPYIVMEYYRGGTLAQQISRSELTVPTVLDYGVKLASALHAAHDRHILHRDVKPQNIFISDFGQPALGDFGISTLIGEQGEQGFTLHYVAPEILDGRPSSPQSDVYSLASTLYYALAGSRPFELGQSQSPTELARRILNSTPPPLTDLELPASIDEAIRIRGLARDPADRYVDAAELGDALRGVQEQLDLIPTPWLEAETVFDPDTPHDMDDPQTHIVPSRSAPTPLQPWWRSPVAWAVAAIVAVVAVVGLMWPRGDDPDPEPEPAVTVIVDEPVILELPSDVQIEREESGDILVTWHLESDDLDVEVRRVGGVLEDDRPASAEGQTATFVDVDEGETFCVELRSLTTNGRVSTWVGPRCLG